MIRAPVSLAKGESILSAFLGFIWEAPYFIFFMTRFFVRPSWSDFAAMLVCAPAVFCLLMCGSFLATRQQHKKVLRYFLGFPSVTLHPVDLSTIVSTDDVDDLLRGLGQDRFSRTQPDQEQRIRFLSKVFFVHCAEPPIPNQVKCYPLMGEPPIVLLRDKPERLSDFGLYKLYHELGHTHPAGAVHAARYYCGTITMVASIIMVVSTAGFATPPWYGSLFAVFVLLRSFGDRKLAEPLQEYTADLWAFSRLRNRIDSLKVISQRRRQLQKAMATRGKSGEQLQHTLQALSLIETRIREGADLPKVLVRLPPIWVWLLSIVLMIFFGIAVQTSVVTQWASLFAVVLTGLILPIGWFGTVKLAWHAMSTQVFLEIRRRAVGLMLSSNPDSWLL